MDNIIYAGTEKFRQVVIQKLTEVFKMGKTEQRKFDYTGFELEQNRQGIKVSQNEYAKDKIEVFEVKPQRARLLDNDLISKEIMMMKQTSGRIGWLAGPDLT